MDVKFFDSCIWIEAFGRGRKKAESIELLEKEENIVINPVVLTEIKYILGKRFGEKEADEAVDIVERHERVRMAPILTDTGKLAATIKAKYNRFSLADSLHLATAMLCGCKEFLTADTDFLGVEEIKTVVI